MYSAKCDCGHWRCVVKNYMHMNADDAQSDNLAIFVAEKALGGMRNVDRVSTFYEAFCAGLKKCNDSLAADAVSHWVLTCKEMAVGLTVETTPEQRDAWLLENLRSQYMQVCNRLTCEPNVTMVKTRMVIFKECLLLWSRHWTRASITAFEWCAAIQHPRIIQASVGADWTEPMRAVHGKCFVVEKDRSAILEMMREHVVARFNCQNITPWIDAYSGIADFSPEIITMLAVERARGGKAGIARMDGFERRACINLEPIVRSPAALSLHDDLCKKLVEFDGLVINELIAPMDGGTGEIGEDVVGTGTCVYGKISWSYPSLFDHVRVDIVLSEEMPRFLRYDMKRRAHIHANRFYEATERKVGVSIWMFVVGEENVVCRVRRGKFPPGDKPIDADARELD